MRPTIEAISNVTKSQQYSQLYQELSELLNGESDLIANAANMSALLFHSLPNVNWVGFYFRKGEELVLGPFQGKPACIRIPIGRGVCGTAAATGESLIVPDVHQFEGHIACDSASQSELAVPLLNWGNLIGVLDLDSPIKGRFDEEDREGCEALASILLAFSRQIGDLPDLSEERALLR